MNRGSELGLYQKRLTQMLLTYIGDDLPQGVHPPQPQSSQEQGGSDVPNDAATSSSIPRQPAPSHDISAISDLSGLVADPSLDNFRDEAGDPLLRVDFPGVPVSDGSVGSIDCGDGQQSANGATMDLGLSRSSNTMSATYPTPTSNHVSNDDTFHRDGVAQCGLDPPLFLDGGARRNESRQSNSQSCVQWNPLEGETGRLISFPSVLEDMPQIDPASADFPSVLEDMPQIDPASADFPIVCDGAVQIDPRTRLHLRDDGRYWHDDDSRVPLIRI
jgi:hypothetical protein